MKASSATQAVAKPAQAIRAVAPSTKMRRYDGVGVAAVSICDWVERVMVGELVKLAPESRD